MKCALILSLKDVIKFFNTYLVINIQTTVRLFCFKLYTHIVFSVILNKFMNQENCENSLKL